MQLRVLEYVVTVADLGSVTAAATALHVTQPAISRQIGELERSLGVSLFQRTPQGLRLTRAGRRFVPIARDILGRVDDGRGVMRAISDRRVSSLTVACPPTAMAYTVAPFVALGGTPIRNIREVPPGDVYAELRNGTVDVAINTWVPPAGLAGRAIRSLPLLVQFPAGHRFEGRATVPIDLLVAESLVVPGRGSAIRAALDKATVENGTHVDSVEETDSSTVAQAIAAAGLGCAVVIEQPRFDLRSARILSHTGAEIPVTQYGAWDPTHYAADEIEQFVSNLSDWAHCQQRNPLRSAEDGQGTAGDDMAAEA